MFQTKLSSRNNLVGSDLDDWSRIRTFKSGQSSSLDIETDDRLCRKKDRKLSFRKLAQRWNNVQIGMDIDIEAGKQLGEKSPSEYWTRVWNDMHNGNGGPPGNLPNSFLREKWTELKDSGKSDQECWDTLEIQYPVAFLGLPLLKRWENLGTGKAMEEQREDMFGWLDEFNQHFLQANLKECLEQSRQHGEEDAFWKLNWDKIHKAKPVHLQTGQGENCVFPITVKNESGDLVRIEPIYKQHYPSEFGRRNFRMRKKSVESQPIFREFDFV